MKKFGAALMALASLLVLSACGQQNNENKVSAVGSTAIQPLVEQASLNYKKLHSDATITVQGGGSGTGLSQLAANAVTIGDSDIFAEQKPGIDASKLVDHQVAVVGLSPIVNDKNGVENLSTKQLQDVFSGKVTNWKQVGGKDLPISIIQAPQGSGAQVTFTATGLYGSKEKPAQEQDSNGTIKKIVSTTPGAIGYLNLPYLRFGTEGITQLKINGVSATYKNITDNKWKMWSYEHMYTNKKTNKGTQKFLDYIKSDAVQNSLIKDAGYVSIKDMKYALKPDGKVIPKRSN